MTNCIAIMLLNWNNMLFSFTFSIAKLAKWFASDCLFTKLINFLINLEPFFIIKSFLTKINLVFLYTWWNFINYNINLKYSQILIFIILINFHDFYNLLKKLSLFIILLNTFDFLLKIILYEIVQRSILIF